MFITPLLLVFLVFLGLLMLSDDLLSSFLPKSELLLGSFLLLLTTLVRDGISKGVSNLFPCELVTNVVPSLVVPLSQEMTTAPSDKRNNLKDLTRLVHF